MYIFLSFAIAFLLQASPSPSTSIFDYYNGHISLSNDEALALVHHTLANQTTAYEETIALYLAGYLYENQNQNIKSIKYSLAALEKTHTLDTIDHYLNWAVSNNIGDALDNVHNYDEALIYYYQALQHAPHAGEQQIAWTHENIGNTYRDMLDASSTIEHYNQALEIYKNSRNNTRIAYMHYKFGLAYYTADLLDTAAYYFAQSSTLQASTNSTRGKSFNYLGMIQAEQGDYTAAYSSMTQGLQYLDGRWDYLTYLDMIEVSLKADKPQRVDSLLSIAYTQYDSSSESMQDHSILSLHADHLEGKEEYKAALALNKRHGHILTTLSAQTERANSEAIAAYAAVILQNHDQFKIIKKNSTQMMVLSTAATIAFIFVIWFAYKRKKRSHQIAAIKSSVKTALS